MDHTDGAEKAGVHDVEAARTLLDRAACITDNVRNTTGDKPDTARLYVEIAREYREIAMAQSYLTSEPLRWMGDVGGEGRAEPEPLPLVPEAASISMVRELEEINNALHEAGFVPPYGAPGVRNLLRLYGAFVGPHVKRAGHSPAPLAPQADTGSAVSASQGSGGVPGGSGDSRPAESDGADSSPGADEICADLTYRDQTDTLWRMIAHHNGQPIMCDWYPRIARWGPMVRTWRELVETYGPISRGALI